MKKEFMNAQIPGREMADTTQRYAINPNDRRPISERGNVASDTEDTTLAQEGHHLRSCVSSERIVLSGKAGMSSTIRLIFSITGCVLRSLWHSGQLFKRFS